MKQAIPSVRTGRPDLDLALSVSKQTLDEITGQKRNSEELKPLPANATLAAAIAQLNAILARIQ